MGAAGSPRNDRANSEGEGLELILLVQFMELLAGLGLQLLTGGLDLSVGLQQLLVLALELIDLVLELLDHFLLPLAFSFSRPP